MTSFKIANVMPEAIGIYELAKSNHNEYKNHILNIIKLASKDFRREARTGTPLYHICSKKDQNLFLNFPELSHLHSEIISNALSYFNLTGFLCENVVVTDAWLNVGKKGAKLHWHNHTNAYISGTYYVNFDPKKHSLLGFKNDRLNSNIDRPSITIPVDTTKKTVYNSPVLQVGTAEGTILYWKSHLVHGYDIPNNSDDRITLSFNIMPKECTDGDIFSFKVVAD